MPSQGCDEEESGWRVYRVKGLVRQVGDDLLFPSPLLSLPPHPLRVLCAFESISSLSFLTSTLFVIYIHSCLASCVRFFTQTFPIF